MRIRTDLTSARAAARRRYVGKRGGDNKSYKQEAINELIVAEALQGKAVVRLKGGDPGIYGRLGPEARAAAAGAQS